MITEDYCSFEIAKLLKEKGFDEFSYYGWDEQLFDKEHPRSFSLGFDNKEHWISCHTHQKAMKWLREVYNVVIVIDVCRETGREGFYCWQLEDNRTGDWIGNIVGECPTYEQACESALKYYLENLI